MTHIDCSICLKKFEDVFEGHKSERGGSMCNGRFYLNEKLEAHLWCGYGSGNDNFHNNYGRAVWILKDLDEWKSRGNIFGSHHNKSEHEDKDSLICDSCIDEWILQGKIISQVYQDQCFLCDKKCESIDSLNFIFIIEYGPPTKVVKTMGLFRKESFEVESWKSHPDHKDHQNDLAIQNKHIFIQRCEDEYYGEGEFRQLTDDEVNIFVAKLNTVKLWPKDRIKWICYKCGQKYPLHSKSKKIKNKETADEKHKVKFNPGRHRPINLNDHDHSIPRTNSHKTDNIIASASVIERANEFTTSWRRSDDNQQSIDK